MDKLSVYVEIGFSKDQEINIDEQLTLTLEGMKKIGIIDSKMELIDKSVVVMDPAYVHINKETEKILTKLTTDFKKQNIHMLGRYGKWTYCSMEDCMIWAEELATKELCLINKKGL